MEHDKPLVSIILPIYNVEKYLSRGIQSARSQTYKSLEIILINDGSTDTSPMICDNESSTDARIRVIHKNNSGVSSARNAGIEAAKGEYIFFLDPDDTIESNTIEEMVNIMKAGDYDLVVCGFAQKFEDSKGNISSERLLLLKQEGSVHKQDIISMIMSDNNSECFNSGSPCNKLYKRNFLSRYRLKFPEDIFFSEDDYFEIDYLDKCNKIYYLQKPLYHYHIYAPTLRKSLVNSYVRTRFDDYKRIYLKLSSWLSANSTSEALKKCKHNFADRVILTCILLCRYDTPYASKELYAKLKEITEDAAVVEAMKYYKRKKGNSLLIPLLIKAKLPFLLMHYASIRASRRYK